MENGKNAPNEKFYYVRDKTVLPVMYKYMNLTDLGNKTKKSLTIRRLREMKNKINHQNLCIYSAEFVNECYCLKVILKNKFDAISRSKLRFASKLVLGIYSDKNQYPSIFFKSIIKKFCSINDADFKTLQIADTYEKTNINNQLQQLDQYASCYTSISTVICFNLNQGYLCNVNDKNFQRSTFLFVIVFSYDQSEKLTNSKTSISTSELTDFVFQHRYEKDEVSKDSFLLPIAEKIQNKNNCGIIVSGNNDAVYRDNLQSKDCKSQSLEITKNEESIFTIMYPSSKMNDIVINTVFINSEIHYTLEFSN